MSTAANTRLTRGIILKVDDLAMGYETTSALKTINGFSAESDFISTTNAASTIADEGRVALPKAGMCDFTWNLNLDDAFYQEMKTMSLNGETRTFKYVLPEGTKNTATFTAWVMDISFDGTSHSTIFTATLVLRLTSIPTWASS